MNYLVEELLKAGVSVLYDINTTRQASRRQLKYIAKKHKTATVLTWVQIDIESAFARVVNRDRRRADDKSPDSAGPVAPRIPVAGKCNSPPRASWPRSVRRRWPDALRRSAPFRRGG